ncbi:MAG: hypothetical protein LLG02_10790 [Pelosinus sp.]|nr:hypothetical protein [Pelosinus sp.]
MIYKYQIKALILAACAILFTGTAAASGEISLEGEYWNPHISGEIKTPAALNPKNNLGLNQANIVDLKLGFKGDKGPKYFIKYENPSFHNTKNIDQSFSFKGGNYSNGDQVQSDLAVKHYQLGIQNEKIISNSKVSVIYTYNHNSVRTAVNNITQNVNRDQEGKSDSVGLGFSWETLNDKGINFFAAATPLSIGTRGGYLDYNIGIKTKVGKTMTLTLGYKGERLEAGKSDVGSTTVNLKGMYIFLGSGF